jgi:hypothetical protein
LSKVRLVFTILMSAAISVTATMAQGTHMEVIDLVPLPSSLTGQPDHSWILEFRETWTFMENGDGIHKDVISYRVKDLQHPEAEEDSLLPVFMEMIEGLPRARGARRFGEFSYEFPLTDQEMKQKNNLHGPVVEMVSRHSAAAGHYKLNEQLLSVAFHETWYIDPDSAGITKKVLALTPVIWQRRATGDGEPVNDAETGLPVFYKIDLERILLRNP